MILRAPEAVTEIELQPIVLWEVVARDEPDAYAVREPEELPAKYDYPKVWKELLAKHEEQAGALHKKRHAIIKRNRMIAACVSVVALLIIAIGAFIYWQTSTFSFGRTMLSYGARQADENAFSKLPPWYHERIAAVYIKHARSGMEYTERSMSCLEYAERYATDAQMAEITDVRIRTLIQADDGKVIRDSGAGQARQEILRLYNEGQLTAEQVVGYAVSMTELYKDEMKNRIYNKLMHDVVYLAEMFRESDARAAALVDTYGPMVNGYDEAVALVRKCEFAAALEYFSQYTYEYGSYRECFTYSRFCEAALNWLGTWRNQKGDTLVIEVNKSKTFEFTTANLADEPVPLYLNVTVTLNGEALNGRFRIREFFGDLECVNSNSIKFKYSGGKVTLKTRDNEYTGFVKQD